MAFRIISTVTAPAETQNLTVLATAKDELSLATSDTTQDSWLTRANAQVSLAIANCCNRVFVPESVKDEFVLTPECASPYRELQLSRFPVIEVASVSQDGVTLVAGVDYRADNGQGFLYRLDTDGNIVNWETLPLIAQYTAGYGARAAETKSIPANPGPYTVTVANAATFAFDAGVTKASVAMVKVASAPAAGQYSVAAGVYTFNAADAGASVVISYLYSQIPGDLLEAALRLITMRFKAKGRDPMLMSQDQQSNGAQRFWVGAAPGQDGAFPPEIMGLLDSYRVPAIV